MNDLDICKRIAEIEGLDFIIKDNEVYERQLDTAYNRYELFDCNPLTDNALCFVLQNKYEVCVHYGSGDVFICGGDNFDGCLSVKSFDVDDKKTLNKAICLAIIEAHKEQ